jgi:hypothetical protein
MPTYTKNGKKLIYTQIDIPVVLPDPADMEDFHRSHGTVNKDYEDIIQNRHDYTVACSRYDVDDWRILPTKQYMDKKDWKVSNCDKYHLNWNPDFVKRFPTLVEAILATPYKEIAFAGWMRQINPYPAHRDSHDPLQPMEPRRYNILLTEPEYNTFWMEDGKGGEVCPVGSKEYPIFAFNNTDVQHGTKPLTKFKLMMGIVGIVDDEKHRQLIERSVNKFPDKAIWIDQ